MKLLLISIGLIAWASSFAAAPTFSVLPGGAKRAAPSPSAARLLSDMRAAGGPVGGTQCFRVGGIVQSVGEDGCLLQMAATVLWTQVETSAAGRIDKQWIAGTVEVPSGGLAFVSGISAKTGEFVSVDARHNGMKKLTVRGNPTQVPRYEIRGPANRPRPEASQTPRPLPRPRTSASTNLPPRRAQ